MKQSFFRVLYSSFIKVNGWLLGGLGVLLSLATAYWFPAGSTVSYAWISPIIVILTILIVVLADASMTMHTAANAFAAPGILTTAQSQSGQLILILDPSQILFQDAIVSIFMRRDSWEELIAIGFVYNVQTDGRVQVIVTSPSADSRDLKSLVDKNVDAIRKTFVKPSAPRGEYAALLERGSI